MRQETNNEIDLLLRRLSRQDEPDSRTHEDHLDADELSSYAENVLPAATRARYTEHLAECGSCRKLIAQLSSSVGIISTAETSRVSAPSALRKFLASLFSPMVLRYAVPALGLLLVAVVGLAVWLRGNGFNRFVARVEQQDRSQAPVARNEQVESPSPGTLHDSQEKTAAPAATPETKGGRAKEIQPVSPPNAAPSVTAGAKQDAPTQKAEQQPSANSPAAPKPAGASDETKKSVDTAARREEIQGRVASELPRERANEPTTGEARRSDEVSAARPDAAGIRAQGAGSIAKLQRDDTGEKDKNDSETRSVAGRRFRRERGVWIDTAYDSGRSTVSLTRGSEQYRALVADEPAIRTIAEQLDGEVIVVWKGRAYRIR